MIRAENPRRDRGGLVAFEGLDASGKSTQAKLLCNWLKKSNIPFEQISFPRSNERGYGEAISMFLRGEFGSVSDVHPYLIASLFAGDRAAASRTINEWINAGRFIVADRYFYSNLAFQSAKIEDLKAKEKFEAWIRYVEFESNGIPKPDLTVYFDVPFEFVSHNIGLRSGESRAYLNGQADIHEIALHLQANVAREYSRFAASDPSFYVLHCASPEGQMREMGSIHSDVIRLLERTQLLRTETRQCL